MVVCLAPSELQSLQRGHHASVDQCSSGKIVLVPGVVDQMTHHHPLCKPALPSWGKSPLVFHAQGKKQQG